MYSESALLIATMGHVERCLDQAICDAVDKEAVQLLRQEAVGAFKVWQFFHPNDLGSKDFLDFESLIKEFDSLPLKD